MILNSAVWKTVTILQLSSEESIRPWINMMAVRYQNGAFSRVYVKEELIGDELDSHYREVKKRDG